MSNVWVEVPMMNRAAFVEGVQSDLCVVIEYTFGEMSQRKSESRTAKASTVANNNKCNNRICANNVFFSQRRAPSRSINFHAQSCPHRLILFEGTKTTNVQQLKDEEGEGADVSEKSNGPSSEHTNRKGDGGGVSGGSNDECACAGAMHQNTVLAVAQDCLFGRCPANQKKKVHDM